MTRWGTRLTVDIDPYGRDWRLRAQKAWHWLQHNAEETEVRISSSGRGLHLIGWFREELDTDERVTIRRTLGDDSNRCRLDSVRGGVGHTTDVTWTEKHGTGTVDRDFDDLYDALDHMDAATPPAQRMKAYVQGERPAP